VVEVEGITNSQGGVTATEIHLRQYQYIGTVEKIDKTSWEISGVKLSITPRTQIEDGIKVGDEVSVLIRSEDNGLYAISILSIELPVTLPSMEPMLQDDMTEIVEATEHAEMENHEAITTSSVESAQDSYNSGHDELQSTPEAPGDSEHESSSTVEPTDNYETEKREGESSTTSEQHGTPAPTEEHEGTP
jgi:hypothetical protein